MFYGSPIQVQYSLEYGHEKFSLLNLAADWSPDSSNIAVFRNQQKLQTKYQVQNILHMNRFLSWFHIILEADSLRILYVDQFASETYRDFDTKFKGKNPLPFGEYVIDLLALYNLKKLEESSYKPMKQKKIDKMMGAPNAKRFETE